MLARWNIISMLNTKWTQQASRDIAYLVGMLAMSIVGFTIWLAGLIATVSLAAFIVGGLAWLATAYALRAYAAIDRGLAGWYRGRPILASYRRPAGGGVIARLRSITADPQTWRDLGWAIANSVLGFAASVAALTVTALVVSYIVMPLWWWAIPHPRQQYARLNFGVFVVNSTGRALIVTALGVALLPLALAINRGVASVHARMVAWALGTRTLRADG
jgi:hypothetical protein